jgi:dynein heavy chain, axonemal
MATKKLPPDSFTTLVTGGWVLLQNVHLSLNFCAEIIDILIETEHVQDSFRLWVTTEVHTEFPIVRLFFSFLH